MPEVVVAVVAIGAIVAFRHYAARQVAARRGRFVWALAFPMILVPVLTLWVGLQLLSTGQILGALFLAIGVGLGATELGYLRRASRAVSATPADQDLSQALVDPLAELLIAWTLGGIVFAVVGALALIVLTRSS